MTEQQNKNVAVENIVRPTIFLLSNKKKNKQKKTKPVSKKQATMFCLPVNCNNIKLSEGTLKTSHN